MVVVYLQTFPLLNFEQAHTPVLIYGLTKFPYTMNISDYSVESLEDIYDIVDSYFD